MRTIVQSVLQSLSKTPLFGKFLRNAGSLFSGSVIASAIGFLTLSLTTRVLDSTTFGLFVLITTYVAIIDSLTNFQSWQAVIKFGAPYLGGRDPLLASVVKLAFCLDVFSALAGTVLGIGAIHLLGHIYQWEPTLVWLASLYSLTVAFHISGAPVGILRLYDRFNLIAVQQVISALIKFAGVLLMFLFDGSLEMFVLVWALSDILGHFLLLYLGLAELARHGHGRFWGAPLRPDGLALRPIVGFMLTTNLNSAALKAVRQADVLIAGTLLGVDASGQYRLVKALGDLINHIATPLRQAFYPEVVKLVERHDYVALKRFVKMTFAFLFAMSAAGILTFLFLGEWIIRLAFGTEMGDIFLPAVIYVAGAGLGLALMPFTPLFLAHGWHKRLFVAYQTSSLLYVAIFAVGCLLWELPGAAGAFLGFYLIYLAFLFATKFIYGGSFIYGSSKSALGAT